MPPIDIGVATDEEEPFGLLALVNSTLTHAAAAADLRFHVIALPGTRRRLRLLLESLFPLPSFRMYTLEVGGVRAKILRHMRRRDRDPVYVSPYRLALAYLPLLLPSLRRLLWLQTDTLVLDDVRKLYDTPLLGAPIGAVPDCTRPQGSRFNTTRVSMVGSLSRDACLFDSGVMLVDLQQWVLLDVTSRVEYWLLLNLRAASFFAHDDALAPVLLALLPLYTPLPAEWAMPGGETGARDVARLPPAAAAGLTACLTALSGPCSSSKQ